MVTFWAKLQCCNTRTAKKGEFILKIALKNNFLEVLNNKDVEISGRLCVCEFSHIFEEGPSLATLSKQQNPISLRFVR